MHLSVVVTTYNRPDALERVLLAFERQGDARFEVIVADDGSTRDTAEMLQRVGPTLRYPLHHVWHEDRGFRAAASRNAAVARARGDYLVFVDGDCMPRPRFIENHRRLAEAGWFVRGSRVLLSKGYTQEVLSAGVDIEQWGLLRVLAARLRGEINRVLPLLDVPDRLVPRRLKAREWTGAKTCNLGVWRSDFERVNGFDEAFVGWGHEDADFVIRLIRSGVRRKEGQFAVPVLHLWHPENDRSRVQENIGRLEDTLASERVRAEVGLARHTS